MTILRCARELHAQEIILPWSQIMRVKDLPRRASQRRSPAHPLDECLRYSGRGVTVADAVVIEASDFTVT